MKYNLLISVLITTSIIISFIAVFLLMNNSTNFNATANAIRVNGFIRMKVDNTISINVPPDEKILFGSCLINNTKNYSIFDSNGSIYEFDNGNCVGGLYPDYMTLGNTGNIDALITVRPSKTGPDFFNDNNSWYAYAFHNHDTESGCSGNLQNSYINFSNTTSYPGCSNLTPGNYIDLSIKAYVTVNASGGGSSDILFTAYAS